jgi:nitrogen regulatory protein PII 2
MKQIIAVIRDECVELTRAALMHLVVTGIVVLPVMGRGQQKGAPGIPDQSRKLGHNAGLHLRRPAEGPVWQEYRSPVTTKVSGFLPKQMLMILANDNDVESIVRVLIELNQSGRHGDGKIFVCPIGQAF